MRILQTPSRPTSDPTARELRVAKLSLHLSRQLRLPPARAEDICTMLDQAVEFSALEGVSASAAIAAFIREGNPWSPVAGWSEVSLAHALPVIPKQASRLLRTSDDTAPSELQNIAATDPVFTAKLLGAANSALLGSRMNIVSPLQAILRLGVPQSRRVLLASCFSGLFASKSLQDTWDHSQSVAERACELAPLCGADPDSTWVAGLLHDIGRLAFSRLPGRLRVCEQDWLAAGFPAVYAESLAYGTDHAIIGAECLRSWELPAAIVEAVEYHHRPECSRSRLGALIYLAEDPTEDLWADLRRASACQTLGIDPDRLDSAAIARSA